MPACPRIQAPGSLGRAGPEVDHRNPLHKGVLSSGRSRSRTGAAGESKSDQVKVAVGLAGVSRTRQGRSRTRQVGRTRQGRSRTRQVGRTRQ
eukprot:gene16250-biopygen12797